MIVLLFKSQLRTDIDLQDYEATRARMMDLVQKVPASYARYSRTSCSGKSV
jgi:hypothetical protein